MLHAPNKLPLGKHDNKSLQVSWLKPSSHCLVLHNKFLQVLPVGSGVGR